MSSNWDRMSAEEALRIKTQGMAMLQFCIQVAAYRLEHGRQFLLEQPGGASSSLGDTRHEMARGTAGCFSSAVRSVRGWLVFETRYSFPENYELHFKSSRSVQLPLRVEVLTRS